MPDFLADAPPWAAVVYWAVSAVAAGIFAASVPRMRAALARVTPEPGPEAAARIVGAHFAGGLDMTKLGHEAERVADALEIIAEAAKSLAKAEEQGTARTLEEIAEKLERLDRAGRLG